jgi:D-sedoheptulose 7-phosphate isomerase
MLQVAILAGGLATRLRPITEKIPKSLVDVAGEPFICRQLSYLQSQGIRRVVLCIGYLGEMIREIVGDGTKFGLDVAYSYDGTTLLGTGGALRQALPLLEEEFFVMYGDSFLPIEFAPIKCAFVGSKKTALMTVLENRDRWDKSNVLFRQGVLIEYNKHQPIAGMTHIDYGLSVLTKPVLENYPVGESFDFAEIYSELSLKGQLAVYEVNERFYEIGSIDGLKETKNYFLMKERLRMSYVQQHLDESIEIIKKIDVAAIEKIADILVTIKVESGRIFFLGVGGSAGNCSHAVNDFRKIVEIESYAPTDNVSELTARTNDDGWASVFSEWLKISKLANRDAVFIFSVGGGDLEKNISPNLIEALKYAKTIGAKIVGVVGRDGGYTAKVADACVIVPTVNADNVTPHSEAFQAVIWHLLVSHPKLKTKQTKWESAVK